MGGGGGIPLVRKEMDGSKLKRQGRRADVLAPKRF